MKQPGNFNGVSPDRWAYIAGRLVGIGPEKTAAEEYAREALTPLCPTLIARGDGTVDWDLRPWGYVEPLRDVGRSPQLYFPVGYQELILASLALTGWVHIELEPEPLNFNMLPEPCEVLPGLPYGTLL